MKIKRVEARPIRLPRDMTAATGTAGSPTELARSASDYRWSGVYPCLYSVNFETALVRVETDGGISGWGEAQAPLAPEVACTIVDRLLAPVLAGEDFDGSAARIEQLWDRMYSAMRVRGQTGGFMLDAISAVDMALYDIAGKVAGLPVCRLLKATPRARIPAYLSGVPRGSTDTKGFSQVKLFYDTDSPEEFFPHMDAVGRHAAIAVDALWRHTLESALAFGRVLDARRALWFEAPLAPEDPLAHARLARALRTPIAIGESYRTRFELEPFVREGALAVFQPDIGRCGITEGLRMAGRAAGDGIRVVPHVSIALGPQIAAALHFAAAAPACDLIEYNPLVLMVANRYLAEPIAMEGAGYVVPDRPGLGIEMRLP
jgi:D-galactarolactone cycloisomerase